jgi:hypothetical protein
MTAGEPDESRPDSPGAAIATTRSTARPVTHPCAGPEQPARRPESEAQMTVLTKAQALGVIRRAYGPDRAESLADRLPERIDLGNPTDHELLFELGLTREQLFEALGAEW